MNSLLKLSFERYGYNYDFLKSIHESRYGGKYIFKGEGEILLKLEELRKTKSKVVILPDFDMDGISSGCVLYAGLSLLGFDCAIYAPNTNAGYGFEPKDIDDILARWPDTKAILTCDVGATCFAACRHAEKLGLTMLVTDHHPEAAEKRVAAYAVMDPARYDTDCDFIGICGAYVAYHLVATYAKMIGNEAVSYLIDRLSIFAMLGSCGDLMPVVYDTRNIIANGVKELNALLDAEELSEYFKCDAAALPEAYRAPFDNIRKLHFWLVRNERIAPGDVTDVDIGFTYCPMFNSVKRMGGSMDDLYDLLYHDHDNISDAAERLWELNAERKALVAEEYARLVSDPEQKYAPYIYLSDCGKPGIFGLLAMKIMQGTGLPCFVLDRNSLTGSGRVPDVLPREILEFKGVSMQGHSNAFGVSIKPKAIDLYREFVEDSVRSEMARLIEAQGEIEDIRPVIAMGAHPCYNGEYDLSVTRIDDYDVLFGYAVEIDRFRPFGKGFEEPEHIFKISRRDIKELRTMGADNSHLRIGLDYNIRMVFFGGASRCLEDIESETDPDRVYKFAGRFSINEYAGSRSLQFMISDRLQ